MRRNMLASDYDGTLFFWDIQNYKEKDLEAIRRFQAEGGLFGICTGRSLEMIEKPVHERGQLSPDFYIAATGAEIADGQGTILYQQPIPWPVLERIHTVSKGNGLCIPKDGTYWCLNEDHYDPDPNNPMQVAPGLDFFKDIDVCTASFEYGDHAEAARQAAFYTREFPELAFHLNNGSVDFNLAGIDKATGVRKAAELFGFGLEDVSVVGDNFNDMSMLENIPDSYTFHTSPLIVQKAANHVVDSVADVIAELETRPETAS